MAIVHSYVNGSASGEHSPWRAQPLLAATGGARILRCLRQAEHHHAHLAL